MNIKNWFEKYKKRKKSAIISDIILVALITIMLIPSWRREFGALMVRVIMTSPDVEETINQPLPESALTLAFASPDGQVNQLGNMLDKPVLLTYWATWCHHCVAELPALVEFQEKAGDDIHLVVLVNEDLNKVQEFLNQKEVQLPIYMQKSAAHEMLYSKKIPASFLIDRNGNLRLKETGATKWNSGEFISFIKNL
jgi:thiol-disulfide isomerase/thioredoxin